MVRDVLELEDAGEMIKLYDGNEADEIVCIYQFNEYLKDTGQACLGILLTAEPTNTNILVRCKDILGVVDLPADNTKELEQVNKARRDSFDKVKIEVEKRKADYLKLFESKGFRVLMGAWTV